MKLFDDILMESVREEVQKRIEVIEEAPLKLLTKTSILKKIKDLKKLYSKNPSKYEKEIRKLKDMTRRMDELTQKIKDGV